MIVLSAFRLSLLTSEEREPSRLIVLLTMFQRTVKQLDSIDEPISLNIQLYSPYLSLSSSLFVTVLKLNLFIVIIISQLWLDERK